MKNYAHRCKRGACLGCVGACRWADGAVFGRQYSVVIRRKVMVVERVRALIEDSAIFLMGNNPICHNKNFFATATLQVSSANRLWPIVWCWPRPLRSVWSGVRAAAE